MTQTNQFWILILLPLVLFSCSNNEIVLELESKVERLTLVVDSLKKINIELSKELSYEKMPESYAVELLQVGGVGSRQTQVQAFYLSEHGYMSNSKEWISYFFNRGGDIINISPIPGYYIQSIKRFISDGNYEEISLNDMGNGQVQIYNQLQNKFIIRFVQSGYEKFLESGN